MTPAIPPDIQIAAIICAVVFVAVAGAWIFIKSRG